MQLTQDDIALLEGLLMNHFRPFSCYFEGVSDAIKEFETDPDYGKTIKTIFETVLFSQNKKNSNKQNNDKRYAAPLAEGKLTHILRRSANWYVRSDKEALRKLALIYEDTLEEVQIAQPDKVMDTPTDSLTCAGAKDTSLLSHLYPTQLEHNIWKQEKWLAKNILGGNIKSVADDLESHYIQNLSISKDAFLTQVGVSFGVAVLSSVLAAAAVNVKEKQQAAISQFCKHYKRHEIHTVLETALQIMYALDDTDKTMATDDITLVLYQSCQLLSDEGKFGLVDWFDLIFDGEALSNDLVKFAPLIYQWIILDVLPSASQKKLPSYILVFEECIPTKTYLNTLANE